MADLPRFSLIFDPEVKRHLRAIASKYHSLIHDAIHQQLLFEPDGETRNRKPLQRPVALGATWELRFGPDNRFRVLYSIDYEVREVQILLIGVKRGNRLLIGEEEVEL
jgi:mRNA-degrading endonuclease RelE of RelBE toxin-antitoxin system